MLLPITARSASARMIGDGARVLQLMFVGSAGGGWTGSSLLMMRTVAPGASVLIEYSACVASVSVMASFDSASVSSRAVTSIRRSQLPGLMVMAVPIGL